MNENSDIIFVPDDSASHEWTERDSELVEDHTIWEGKQLHGYPIRTYLRGNVVYDNGDFVGTPGLGEYVKRSPRKH